MPLIRELASTGMREVPRGVATAVGVVLTLCGALLALASVRFPRRIAADILHNPMHWDPRLDRLLTGLLVLAGAVQEPCKSRAGAVLAVYLLLTG